MEKPDFTQIHKQKEFQWMIVYDFVAGCEHVWNTYVVPLQEDHDLRGRQLDHYRDQTQKIRTFVFNRNDFGLPNQNIFEAVNDHITQLESENKLLREQVKLRDEAMSVKDELLNTLREEIERLKAEVLREKFPPN